MYIVTTAVGGERGGCLVGFTSQCSIDPPRFCAWMSKANHTFRLAQRATFLGVHTLRRGDQELAELFGEETGDTVDKFARCAWSDGPHGIPILDGCDWFLGRVLARYDGGDHVGHVLDLLRGVGRPDRALRAGEPQLGFQDVRGFRAGHET
jgi:flavin reductase (DIM6/NTAB) family NADH-FMN oxidoreductase RutF